MPARKLKFTQGAYYHIFNRGANRMPIFRKAENYEYVLRLIKKYREKYNIAVIAYSLMPNHYHLFVRQDGEHPAGQLAQQVFNSYSKAYNNAYDHSGTLFETRFKAILVESDPYLHHLCRYIHGNAVVAGIATSPELWPYTNYLEWIGARNGTLFERTFIDAHFQTIERYQTYLNDYLHGKGNAPKGFNDYLNSL